MPKSRGEEIDEQIYDIFYNENSIMRQAYFNNDHQLHQQAVEKMERLAMEKLGDVPLPPEVMPVHTTDWFRPKS